MSPVFSGNSQIASYSRETPCQNAVNCKQAEVKQAEVKQAEVKQA